MYKKTILTFVRWYLPGYKSGGPVRTISNMVDQLGDEFDFWIVTSDRDATDTEPYSDIKINEWNQIGKSRVFYAAPGFMTFRNVSRLIRETDHDVLYLNSFWNPRFTVLPLLGRRFGLLPKKPVILAPRGQFSQGALALKQLKKKVFLQTSRATGLYRNIRWQASSEYEKEDIFKTIGNKIAKDICVAPDLPQKLEAKVVINHYRARKPYEPLRVIFLSRISPKKNLDFALEVLAKVEVPVVFDIYGPIRDESYWGKCKALIRKIPDNAIINYKGGVEHSLVAGVLSMYDLFFLPTAGENFGHVILESLLVGTPVLIADTTPWRNLKDAGVGWDFPLDTHDSFTKTIENIANLSFDNYLDLRKACMGYASQKQINPDTISANRLLFSTLITS